MQTVAPVPLAMLNSSPVLLIPDPEQVAKAAKIEELLKRLRKETLAKKRMMADNIMAPIPHFPLPCYSIQDYDKRAHHQAPKLLSGQRMEADDD